MLYGLKANRQKPIALVLTDDDLAILAAADPLAKIANFFTVSSRRSATKDQK